MARMEDKNKGRHYFQLPTLQAIFVHVRFYIGEAIHIDTIDYRNCVFEESRYSLHQGLRWSLGGSFKTETEITNTNKIYYVGLTIKHV